LSIKLSPEQSSDLNAGWYSVYRRIYGVKKWESVRDFIGGLGRLNFSAMSSFQMIKLCKMGLLLDNQTYKNVMRMHYLSPVFKKLCMDAGLSSLDHVQLRCRSINYINNII